MTAKYVIPCLYNSFSLTPENINETIGFYDVSSFRQTPIPVHAQVKAEAVPEAAVPEIDTEDTDSVDTVETVDSVDTVETADLADPVETADLADPVDTADTNKEIFHPDMMRSYCVSPSATTTTADSLLWVIYIIINGHEQFEVIENHYTESSKFKFELVELIRKNKPILKANKLKLSALEEGLVHKQFIHLETLHAIALCTTLSVCIVQDRKYYEIQNGSGGSGCTIIEKIKGKYILYACPEKINREYLKYIRANYWLMESISTPIRAMSAYKLQDLVDISLRLGLPVSNIIPGKFGSIGTKKQKTKPELYEAICKHT